VLTVETLVILPVLLIITIAIIEFGIVLSVGQAVNQAAIQGAREAAKGATTPEVRAVVEQVLSGYSITLDSDEASLIIEDPPATDTVPDPLELDCDPPALSLAGTNVRVTVCVSPQAAVPITGQLESFGLSFFGRMLTKSAVAQRECL
jgi:Flp pilus assembly protein TadG